MAPPFRLRIWTPSRTGIDVAPSASHVFPLSSEISTARTPRAVPPDATALQSGSGHTRDPMRAPTTAACPIRPHRLIADPPPGGALAKLLMSLKLAAHPSQLIPNYLVESPINACTYHMTSMRIERQVELTGREGKRG